MYLDEFSRVASSWRRNFCIAFEDVDKSCLLYYLINTVGMCQVVTLSALVVT